MTAFDASKHCGANGRGGNGPCRRPKGWGTNHLGTGKCKLHGGGSTGARSPKGREKAYGDNGSHGLYGKVLVGKNLVHYQEIKSRDPTSILEDNFALIQARILTLVEGEGNFKREAEILLKVAQALQEQGQLSQEFVIELRYLLLGVDAEKLARVMNNSATLLKTSVEIGRMGELRSQLEILKNFLVDVLRSCNDRITRQNALQTLTILKLEAGVPSEILEEMMQNSRTAVETVDIESLPEGESNDDHREAETRVVEENP